ncbi:MAG: resuscitation-promoting factor RpfB [Actinomycetota bacterium]|jgi:peptidoglycan hydrolase CwlO-like protein|nr:resuscitation-promoting factor RpfB [Actinomycetota bacterium]
MPLVRFSGSRALLLGLFVAFLATGAVVCAPLAAAQTGSDTGAAALRSEADTLSSRYFSALERVQSLDADIARNEQEVADLSARAKQARDNARARALVAYTNSGTQLGALIDGADSLDTARRAHLIDHVNAHDQAVYTKLAAATRDLHKQQRILRDTRQAQASALSELRDQGAAIDAKLARAVQQEQAAAASAAQAAAVAAAPSTSAPQQTGSAGSAGSAAPAPTTTTAAPASAPAPPPGYTGTPGTNPHHDDPFLACVRQRESGGNYGAVNPAGPYLGAYQFLQSTWNVTASHAGRSDLVGLPPNLASAYDQDEMAWVLYQWQGTGPWGGGCP